MWETLQDNFAWMAWTWQVGDLLRLDRPAPRHFHAARGPRPETPRVGILAIPTTRGDRLFITLLGSAFIHLFWLAFAPDGLGPVVGLASLPRLCRRGVPLGVNGDGTAAGISRSVQSH